LIERLIPSALDAGIIALVVGGLFVGMKIGFVSALFDVLGGLVGSWAAGRFYVLLFPSVPAFAYLTVFLMVAGALVGTGIWLSQKWERHFLGLEDKFLGGLLGMGLSYTLATALLIPALMSPRGDRAWILRSPFAASCVKATQRCFFLMPKATWDKVGPLLETDGVGRARRLIQLGS